MAINIDWILPRHSNWIAMSSYKQSFKQLHSLQTLATYVLNFEGLSK